MRKKRMMRRQRQRRAHEGEMFYIVPHSEGASHGHTVVYKIRICTMILRRGDAPFLLCDIVEFKAS